MSVGRLQKRKALPKQPSKGVARTRGKAKSGRLAASAWTEAGLDLLALGGVESVRIDELARVLGVTKGSFYWHFEDRAHLLRSMLESWRRSATLAVIARLDSEESPVERLGRLIELPVRGKGAQHGQSLELAMRLWAKHDANAAAAIEEIDQHRLAYVGAQLRAIGYPETKAGARAYLIYGFILAEALISSKAASHVVNAQSLRRLVDELIEGKAMA